jgi:hypothetical protein
MSAIQKVIAETKQEQAWLVAYAVKLPAPVAPIADKASEYFRFLLQEIGKRAVLVEMYTPAKAAAPKATKQRGKRKTGKRVH